MDRKNRIYLVGYDTDSSVVYGEPDCPECESQRYTTALDKVGAEKQIARMKSPGAVIYKLVKVKP